MTDLTFFMVAFFGSLNRWRYDGGTPFLIAAGGLGAFALMFSLRLMGKP